LATAVTMIPPTVRLHTAKPLSEAMARKVCAYARVSTDNEEQLTSYDAQVEYYTKYIKEHKEWEFAGLYSDEGRSGTSIKHRPGFQKMIDDAMNGKIDLIITKSISRFARNTVDSISTVRKLKARGVEVYFEKDGLWTFDPSAELTITILSSIAQEESRNLSQNVTWGQRARFADGKVTMSYKRFLGYDRGEDGNPVINEEQAELVRRIYAMFINGMTPTIIAKQLTQEKVQTPGGRHIWQTKVIESILTNEKYKGDALLQKTFCTDYLTKKMKLNEGEIPQYYVEGSHPPIVSSELFDLVQAERQRRKGIRFTASTGCFSGRIICGDCGSVYGSKVWHSTSKYRRTIWRCNRKYEKDGDKCSTPHFYEEQLKNIFLGFINSLITDRSSIISAYKEVVSTLTDNTAFEEEYAILQSECEIVMELMRKMVQENTRTTQDQAEYQQRYSAMVERFNKANGRLSEVEKMIEGRNAKRLEIERVIKLLKKQENLLTEFDEGLWQAIVHQLKIHSATEFTFILKDGTELPWRTGR
jgi:site-specific DNA recombinase